MNLQTFLMLLLIISTMVGLTVEAIKKILQERNKTYYANALAGAVSIVLSVAAGFGYIVLIQAQFTQKIAVYLIALVFLSWLSSMVGYDKVVQAITQISKEDK